MHLYVTARTERSSTVQNRIGIAMAAFEVACYIRGYHIFREIWEVVFGEMAL